MAGLERGQLALPALLANLPGLAYRCRNDPDRTMEFASEGCLALTGYRPADLVASRVVAYAELIHPDDRDRVWREVQGALRARRRFQVTYRLRTADGGEKWVCEQGCGVASPEGLPRAVEGFVSDAPPQVGAYRALEERAAERAREVETLLEIARNIASTLDLGPLLGLILDQLRAAVDYHAASLMTLEGEELVQAAVRSPLPDLSGRPLRVPLERLGVVWHTLSRGEPVLLRDVWGDSPAARDYRRGMGEERLRARPHVRSWLAAPLRFQGRVLGLLLVTRGDPDAFTPEHMRVVAAVASQAAVAIENARLYERGRALAALEERQRLARELHDAVTQALFSASLIGEVLPGLWERDPARGRQSLEDLRLLTRGALAEMRALLLELRPAALTEAPLGDLLRHLVDAAAGRTRLPVGVVVDGPPALPALPPEVQVALYRIAQEALHNVAKHAEAERAELQLSTTETGVALRIRDDGRGFDPARIPPGHFGVGMMRERAAAIGARLTVASAPGRGTEVRVMWPADPSGTDPRAAGGEG